MAKNNTETEQMDLDVLSFAETTEIVKASVQSNQPITIEGSPGVGKTAMMHMIGKELTMPVETLILSQCEPTDIGGYPIAQPNGSVDRLPLGAIKKACDGPVILFLDELTTAPPAVQAASLRLIHERVAGDRELHPGTRLVAAQNPVNEAAGGYEAALPLVGRVTRVKMIPKYDEIQEYFLNLIPAEGGGHARVLSRDFAITLGSRTNLVQLKPPGGSSTSGQPWAAPRAWERAIRLGGQILDNAKVPLDAPYIEDDKTNRLFYAALAGNLGADSATAFVALRKLRDRLPTVKEILKAPDTVKVPSEDEVELHVAALGVVSTVAETDPCAAMVYAARLQQEISTAALRMLGKFPNRSNTSPWFEKSEQALKKIILGIANAVQRNYKASQTR